MRPTRLSLIVLTAALAFATGSAVPLAAAEPEPVAAEKELQPLVSRQQTLLADAEKAGDNLDEENFRRSMQRLSFDYEDYLKKHPRYAPAYTAYGVMLGKIDMRKESAAVLQKAESLYVEADRDPAVRTPAFRRAWALARNQLGNYVAEEGRPVQALAYFLGAVDLVPDEPLYHYQVGSLLTDAREDFLKESAWTAATIEKTMHDAFRRAAELAPDRIEFTYRFAESFYDLEKPDWEAALRAWAALEERADNPIERETMRLHAANVLIKQGRHDHARALLGTVAEPSLLAQKEKLVAQVPAAKAD